MPDDLADRIEEVASEPAEATAPGRSAKNQPIRDLIAADEYLSAKAARNKTKLPIRIGAISPGGAP
jgi:hypothetical protein